MRKVMLVMMALGIALCAAPVPALAGSETATTTFYVPATAGGGTDDLGGAPWFESGLILKRGTVVTVTATGFWLSCKERTCRTTADGIGVRQVADCAFIAPDLSAFGLIVQTGKKAPVLAGAGPTTIQGGGTLRFAINDCYFGDNIGGFNVTVTYPADAVLTVPDAETTGE